jgi:phosphoribosylformimino-5-aminoimidazole carboxamide ribotide isomerase
LKIYPTLNIQNGRVVSTAGELDACSEAPDAFAARLVEEGANRLALVDVDAALGKGNNRDLLGQILKRCRARERKVCVQVAGGIRSSDQAQYFLDLGATWLVVGTILHKSPLVSEQLMARFQTNLVAAIDARGGRVHRSGWVDVENLSALALAQRARSYGFRRLLFVDLPEEVGAAPDFQTAEELASATGLPLIMGGSLTTHAHLEALQTRSLLRGGLVDALLFQKHPELQAFIQVANA